jgi:hypothetical protein
MLAINHLSCLIFFVIEKFFVENRVQKFLMRRQQASAFLFVFDTLFNGPIIQTVSFEFLSSIKSLLCGGLVQPQAICSNTLGICMCRYDHIFIEVHFWLSLRDWYLGQCI